MAKLINALIMILMIEVGLFLFQGAETTATNLMGLTVSFPAIPILGIAATDISFITGLIIALGILTTAGIFVGTFSNTVTFAVYALPAIAFIALFTVIVQLGEFVSSNLGAANPIYVTMVNALFIVPLIIYYGLAVFEWVRSNQ